MEWLDELAKILGVPALTDAEAEALLAVSREVAHGVERKATPLAAFLLGRAVQARGSGSFTEALADLRGLTPVKQQDAHASLDATSGTIPDLEVPGRDDRDRAPD